MIAREKAAKIAQDAERRSIPGVASPKADEDPTVQTNVMMEAAELRERAQRIEKQTPDGLNAGGRVMEMLRNEYAGAIETGGITGATICRAVLRAGKVLGIPEKEIYGHLREQKHRDALEEARLYRQAEQLSPPTYPAWTVAW